MSPFLRILALALALSPFGVTAAGREPHNVILFVPDGLRALKVTPQTAPAMAAIRDQGTNFKNSHSLFPTITMSNASGMSTGHLLGDTGTFNTIYTGYKVPTAGDSVTPFLESDAILGEVDAHFAGNYMNEETVLAAAREKGFSTAAIGKHGPTFLFDHTDRTGTHTIIVDDATGTPNGIPLSQEMQAKLTMAGLPLATPARGDNGKSGDFKTPGTTTANVTQQAYLADVATKAVLPLFKERGKPFVMVYWSRDPDGSQHNQGDSFNSLTPGINGPTSLAAIKNADDNLAALQRTLKELGLAETTDIIIAADHGFSTISKESKTSPAAKGTYADVTQGQLPQGFLAIDLAKALDLPLFDPDNKDAAVADNTYPKHANGLIGQDPEKPELVVTALGGNDFVYLPGKDGKLAERIVQALFAQDYVSGIFVNDELGKIPGTLPLSSISLIGKGRTPQPSIVVNFRSFTTECGEPTLCTVEVSDTNLQQGQGNHGNFNRADTMNFMAAAGPDFKAGFIDETPVSNADIGRTIAQVLGLNIPPKGTLIGRVIEEAMPGGANPPVTSKLEESTPGPGGLKTMLAVQQVGAERYYDAAGFSGRTVGLPPGRSASR